MIFGETASPGFFRDNSPFSRMLVVYELKFRIFVASCCFASFNIPNLSPLEILTFLEFLNFNNVTYSGLEIISLVYKLPSLYIALIPEASMTVGSDYITEQ